MKPANPRNALSLAQARSRKLFGSVILFSVFTNILMLTGPLFMLQVYDRVLGSRSEETLVAMFALVAALFAFYGVLEFARGRVAARIGIRLQAVYNVRVFKALLELAATIRGASKASASIADLDAVRSIFASPIFLAVLDLPWTPVFLFMVFVFHPILGWVALVGGGILIAVAILNQILTSAKVREGQHASAIATNFARQSEEGGELLWSQGMGQSMSTRWVGLQNAAMEQSAKAADWTGSFSSFTKAFRFFLQSAMLAVGAWLVLENEITPGAMIAASILMGRALAPIEQSIGQWAVFQRARAGWHSLNKLLTALPEPAETMELPRPDAALDVGNVSVAISRTAPPVLSGVNFKLAPGKALGVIGKSGSGKTTLARVLMGLVHPTAGEVRLAGATIAQYGPEQYGAFVGYLPQDVILFDGTIAENIAHMAVEPDSESVVEAARKARVHDVITALPDGYNTILGRGDVRLSGGQKQRLALARALYKDPVLLILDEPNSALDAEGSDALNAVVKDMKSQGKAVLVMTHRPTAIFNCDDLLVLEKGRVAAFGPTDDVMKSMVKNASDIQKARGIEGGKS